jgi:PKD repeat protein
MNPIENYMDYTEDGCMTRFTLEQVNRLRCSLINYRRVNTAPSAAFTAAVGGRQATFVNASSDAESPAALVYAWDFGDGQTSTERDPVHAYAAAGTYAFRRRATAWAAGPT